MELNQLNSISNEDIVTELLTLTCRVDGIGTKYYYNKEGQVHRMYGPAIIYADGTEFWYRNNILHREDGPARCWDNGDKEWCKEGQLHREDGPAVLYSDGSKEYYINNKRLTKKEFIRWQKDNGITPSE